jgi:hypothetical protein
MFQYLNAQTEGRKKKERKEPHTQKQNKKQKTKTLRHDTW